MWLLMVAAGHAALFYLFRVAPPLTSRKPPPQHAVLYLPSDEGGVRALLGALGDRYPGAVRRSEDYDLKTALAALAKATPPSEPSWSTHAPALKPFPQPLVPLDLPALLQPGEPVFPEASPAAAPLPDPDKVKPVPYVVIDGASGGRSVVQRPVWPGNLIDEGLRSGSAPFMLGVARTGRPEYCLPLSPAGSLDLEALRRVLMTMKFNAVAAGGLQWINVSVRW
jgi:hypothetical protein